MAEPRTTYMVAAVTYPPNPRVSWQIIEETDDHGEPVAACRDEQTARRLTDLLNQVGR